MATLKREASRVQATNPFVTAGVAASDHDASAAAPSGIQSMMSTRVVTKGRRCQASYDVLTMIIRVLSAFTCLSSGVAGGWAVYQAHLGYTSSKSVAACTTNFIGIEQFYIFLGLIGIYYAVFSLLGFFAEVRHHILRRTVLKPFGFLLMWIGRGVYYIILGALLVELPIESKLPESYQQYLPAQIPGAFLLFCGACQILVSIFVRQERGVVRPTVDVGGRAQAPRSPGATMNWGASTSDDGADGDIELAAQDPAPAPAMAPTPSKAKLLPSSSAPSVAPNPFLKS